MVVVGLYSTGAAGTESQEVVAAASIAKPAKGSSLEPASNRAGWCAVVLRFFLDFVYSAKRATATAAFSAVANQPRCSWLELPPMPLAYALYSFSELPEAPPPDLS